MLTRNLDPQNGHVNGARYIVLELKKKIIHARLATGPHKGKTRLHIQFSFYFLCTKSTFFQERKSLFLELSFIQKTESFQWRWNASNFQSAFVLVSLQISPRAKPTRELVSTCPMQRCFHMDNCMLPCQELDQQKQFPFSNQKVNLDLLQF